MKKIFICSPLRGNIKKNQSNAKKYARDVSLSGNIPIVPHIYFTQFLNENDEQERLQGIKSGIALMDICDEMYVYGKPTEGMKMEIEYWNKNQKGLISYFGDN